MQYILIILVFIFSCQSKKNYDELVTKADSLAESGNYVRAIELYNEAIRIKDNDFLAYNNRSFSHFQLGNNAKAISDVNKAMKLDSNLTTIGNRALYYQYSGNHQAAIIDYNLLIPYDSSAENFNNRGLSFYYVDNYDKALLDYSTALEIDSTYSETYNNLSLLYVNNSQFELAVEACTQSLFYNSENVYAYGNRGWAKNFLENYDEAIIDFNKALEIDSTFQPAYVNRAISYAKLGKLDKACADYKKAKILGFNEPEESLEELCGKE